MLKKIDRYALEILIIVSLIGIALFMAMKPDFETSYIEHTVASGETVWEIAERYADKQEKPFNEFVYQIQADNKLSGRYIQPGDTLVIPLAVVK